MKYFKYILTLVIIISILGCGNYSFTGVQKINANTFQVNYFQNNARLIEPGVDRAFTTALQDIIQNQTSLSLVILIEAFLSLVHQEVELRGLKKLYKIV